MAVAIVLAGGSGNRMKSGVAKQYMLLNGHELLSYCLETFQKHEKITDIVLVVRRGDENYCQSRLVERYGFDKVRAICAGGANRYDSVNNGLKIAGDIIDKNTAKKDTKPDWHCACDGIVMIHDGARPFLTAGMIDDSIEAASEFGACTVGVPVKDTIKLIDNNGFGIETPDRKYMYQVQTPQTFKIGLIREAYCEMMKAPNPNITDDTMLVEQYKGVRSKMVMGDYKNIKITTPEDMKIAEKFAENYWNFF